MKERESVSAVRKSFNHKVYALLFFSSLILFLLNFFIQGHILFTYSDFYGIIFKLGWVYWIGYIILLALISFHYLNFKGIEGSYAYLTIILTVIYLISTPFLYEQLPRFEDTWAHSLVSQTIYDEGKIDITGNIYEKYPGAFVFYGMLLEFMPNFYIMRFFPFVFYVFGIIVIFLTLKGLVDPRIAMLITIVYMFFNWTVEDNHISPQFLMLNFYFIFMLLATRIIFKNPDKKEEYFFLIALFSLIIVFSHVFTPVFIISILVFSLVLCGKIRKQVLPILIIVSLVFISHEVYVAVTINSVLAYIENFAQNFLFGSIFERTASRFTGVSFISRQVVLGSRMFMLAISLVVGFLGILTLHRGRYRTFARFVFSWSFAMLPFVLFMIFVLGGTFSERFTLVSSLPLAIGTVFFLTKDKPKWFIIAFLLFLTPFFFLSKYGNEAFESQSIEKLKVDCYIQYFDSSCYEESVIVKSSLDYDIENLGETHFGVSREEILSAYIYGEERVEGNILDIISEIEDEKMLNRVYSTNNAWSYLRYQ